MDSRPARLWFGRTTSTRYEVWQDDGDPVVLRLRQLDELLDARRYPADFWAAVKSADDAFDEGDRRSSVEFGTARRVADPLDTAE